MGNTYDAEIGQEGGQQQEQPAAQPRQQRGSPYDGMIAENAQGHRVIYRSNAQGRGRWVELSAATADPASREMLEAERNSLNVLRNTGRNAEAFLQHNAQSGTGGLGQAPWVPRINAPHRQAMQSLNSQMVRDNIRPGMAQTMNSDAEAQRAERTYPSESNAGDVNAEIAVRTLTNRDLQIELIYQMEQWLTQHPSLDGFQRHWQSMEPGLRDQIVRMHATRYPGLDAQGRYSSEGRDWLGQVPAERRRRPRPDPAPAAGGTVRFERDPATGEIRRVHE